jgi:transketolase
MISNIYRGGYTLLDCSGEPDLIMIATGSEVGLAMESAKELSKTGEKIRVVSMPSTDVFLSQDLAYQESVLPTTATARLAIEAASSDGWYKFVGCHGKVIGLDRFGASAPAKDVFKECGFSVEQVVSAAKKLLAQTIKNQEKKIHDYSSCN